MHEVRRGISVYDANVPPIPAPFCEKCCFERIEVNEIIFMAEQGMGITYLPDFAISRQLREGVFVTVLDDYTERSGPLRVLWPSSRHLAPKLRVFVDFLAANLVPAVEGDPHRAGDSGISS